MPSSSPPSRACSMSLRNSITHRLLFLKDGSARISSAALQMVVRCSGVQGLSCIASRIRDSSIWRMATFLPSSIRPAESPSSGHLVPHLRFASSQRSNSKSYWPSEDSGYSRVNLARTLRTLETLQATKSNKVNSDDTVHHY